MAGLPLACGYSCHYAQFYISLRLSTFILLSLSFPYIFDCMFNAGNFCQYNFAVKNLTAKVWYHNLIFQPPVFIGSGLVCNLTCANLFVQGFLLRDFSFTFFWPEINLQGYERMTSSNIVIISLFTYDLNTTLFLLPALFPAPIINVIIQIPRSYNNLFLS